MKIAIRQIIFTVPLLLFFMFVSFSTNQLFHNQLNEEIEAFRKYAVEQGMPDNQILTISSAISGSAETAYSSAATLYNSTIIVLIILLGVVLSRIIGLNKEIKEIKEKLNV